MRLSLLSFNLFGVAPEIPVNGQIISKTTIACQNKNAKLNYNVKPSFMRLPLLSSNPFWSSMLHKFKAGKYPQKLLTDARPVAGFTNKTLCFTLAVLVVTVRYPYGTMELR